MKFGTVDDDGNTSECWIEQSLRCEGDIANCSATFPGHVLDVLMCMVSCLQEFVTFQQDGGVNDRKRKAERQRPEDVVREHAQFSFVERTPRRRRKMTRRIRKRDGGKS